VKGNVLPHPWEEERWERRGEERGGIGEKRESERRKER
jgi:hypothetical protein